MKTTVGRTSLVIAIAGLAIGVGWAGESHAAVDGPRMSWSLAAYAAACRDDRA
ncbi:MAG: hypothetical protein U1E97_08735 [Alphaproteobacteria bacterium]